MNKKLLFSLLLAMFNVVLCFGSMVKISVPDSALRVSYCLITAEGGSDFMLIDGTEKIINLGADVKFVKIVCDNLQNSSQITVQPTKDNEMITITAQDWFLNGIHWTIECKKVGADAPVHCRDTVYFYNDRSPYVNVALMIGYQFVNPDFPVQPYWTAIKEDKAKIERKHDGQIIELRCGKSMISLTDGCGDKTVEVNSNANADMIFWSVIPHC